MVDEFGTGALSFVILEDMKDQDIETLADDIEDLKGVNDVIWYGTIADSTLPREAIPDEVYDAFNNKDANSQLMLVTYRHIIIRNFGRICSRKFLCTPEK